MYLFYSDFSEIIPREKSQRIQECLVVVFSKHQYYYLCVHFPYGGSKGSSIIRNRNKYILNILLFSTTISKLRETENSQGCVVGCIKRLLITVCVLKGLRRRPDPDPVLMPHTSSESCHSREISLECRERIKSPVSSLTCPKFTVSFGNCHLDK